MTRCPHCRKIADPLSIVALGANRTFTCKRCRRESYVSDGRALIGISSLCIAILIQKQIDHIGYWILSLAIYAMLLALALWGILTLKPQRK